MAIVVSDTSPIRALHHLGLLHLLSEIFGEVVIPPAVASEMLRKGRRFASINSADLPFVRVVTPRDAVEVASLRQALQAGESEAIVLALELDADLLIDEAAGRAEAKRRGLHTIGAIGVLILAKQIGLIQLVLPLLVRLQNELGFYISAQLYDEVRHVTNE